MSHRHTDDPNAVEGTAQPTAQERVLLRGRLRWHRILDQTGGLLDSTQVAQRLGISQEAVRRRARHGSLIAFKQGGCWRYPAIQFIGAGVLPGLPKVIEALDASPVRQVTFLLTVDDDGETPAEALATGDPCRIERVLTLAEEDGEHGAT